MGVRESLRQLETRQCQNAFSNALFVNVVMMPKSTKWSKRISYALLLYLHCSLAPDIKV